MPQTTIQKQDSIRFGSGKLEMGANFGALTNLGAVRNLVFNSLKEDVQIDFDNTNPMKKFVKGIDASITVDIAEIDMTTFSLTDAGWAIVTPVAGAPVAGETDLIVSGTWSYNEFQPIEHQNGDGSTITINSVVGATDGALVSETDYFKGQDSDGVWGIFIKDSATVTTLAQNITIDYDYTPNASKVVTFNDFGTKTLKVARITNTNSAGKTFIIDMENVTNTEPWVLPFLADDSDDVAVMSLTLTGTVQDITDEQSTT
jgi:hypothetical protein